MLKVISFDMDGTLVVKNFADAVWFEGIPKLYARRFDLPFERALEEVKRAYDEVGPSRIEWYDIKYWFRRFNLGSGWAELLERYRNLAEPYPEVPAILEKLGRKYSLIIVSAAAREFINLAIGDTSLSRFFVKSFSAISDFGLIGKQPELFSRVCQDLCVKPQELLHVGDHVHHDFEVPRKAGVRTILLDRDGEADSSDVIHSLDELPPRLESLS